MRRSDSRIRWVWRWIFNGRVRCCFSFLSFLACGPLLHLWFFVRRRWHSHLLFRFRVVRIVYRGQSHLLAGTFLPEVSSGGCRGRCPTIRKDPIPITGRIGRDRQSWFWKCPSPNDSRIHLELAEIFVIGAPLNSSHYHRRTILHGPIERNITTQPCTGGDRLPFTRCGRGRVIRYAVLPMARISDQNHYDWTTHSRTTTVTVGSSLCRDYCTSGLRGDTLDPSRFQRRFKSQRRTRVPNAIHKAMGATMAHSGGDHPALILTPWSQ